MYSRKRSWLWKWAFAPVVLLAMLACTSSEQALKESAGPLEQVLKEAVASAEAGMTREQLDGFVERYAQARGAINGGLLSEFPHIAEEMNVAHTSLQAAQKDWVPLFGFDDFVDVAGKAAMESEMEAVIEDGRIVLESEPAQVEVKRPKGPSKKAKSELRNFVSSAELLLDYLGNL